MSSLRVAAAGRGMRPGWRGLSRVAPVAAECGLRLRLRAVLACLAPGAPDCLNQSPAGGARITATRRLKLREPR